MCVYVCVCVCERGRERNSVYVQGNIRFVFVRVNEGVCVWMEELVFIFGAL